MTARLITRTLLLALTAAIVCGAPAASAQDKIKIGYWTSGFSVGFGAVLEAGKFVEQQGLVPEYIRFAEVNAPTKAILTQSIDVAFAAPTSGAFTLGIQGAPVEIALATQIAEATFVTKEGSPIKSITDLKGKKVGMSPVGSATYAIAAAVLEKNFGLKPSDYTPVGGNEGQLVAFLQRGDIDAASATSTPLRCAPSPSPPCPTSSCRSSAAWSTNGRR
jgi:ABC-type nitrate/sulfonate/bicarbonate transport system substrate-binding protein